MALSSFSSYLVFPGKHLEEPQDTQGAMLPLSGNLFNMLLEVFDRSDYECNIPIRFVMAADGSQTNEAMDLILDYISNPSIENGRLIANRLRDYTTNKSGLGLLFLLLGNNENGYKFVLSRFPADQGVVAEARRDTLAVEFIERVFMKSAASYKAARYEGDSFDSDFWSGNAVDKQLNATNYQIAYYWIREFLASDFETTSKAGTKRFARALRDASKTAEDLSTKHEIVALSTLMRGLTNQAVSIQDIMERFSLSDLAREEITSKLPYDELVHDIFQFDLDEFANHAPFASVELHTGGILIAPPDRFEECFEREMISEKNNEYRFTTEGRVVDERILGRK